MLHDDFDKGFWRTFAKMGAIAVVLNIIVWGAIIAMIVVALNITGVV